MLSIGKKSLAAAVALVISLSVPAVALAAPATDNATVPAVANEQQSVVSAGGSLITDFMLSMDAEQAADQALFAEDLQAAPNLDAVPTDVGTPADGAATLDTAGTMDTAAPTTESTPTILSTRVHGWQISTYALHLRHYGYRFGSEGPYYYDCSSYVQLVYRHFGIRLPRTTYYQSRRGTFISKSHLLPGDLVFFKNTYKAGVSHVGIYIGGGKFIHDWPRTGTIVSSLSSTYFRNHYWGAKRVW